MCESTIVLPRPKRRSSVQVEKALVEKVCLTIRKPNDDEDGSSNTSTSARSPKIKENEKPEAGRLQKLKELRTAFSMLDANHDGRVSLEELEDMLCRMGFNIPHETLDLLLQDKATSPEGQNQNFALRIEKAIRTFFEMGRKRTTTRSSIGVSLNEFEFLQWIDDILSKDAAQSGAEDVDQDIIAAFKIFDTDGDGFITRAELRRAMDTIGEKLTEEELDDILRQTDADRDGRIDYQEFAAALM